MAILAECPTCHKRQKVANKICSCNENLDKAKRSGKIKYWIIYRVGGRQKWELAGGSIEKARDAEGKRRSQKREGRIFDIKPECKMTFEELRNWYLGLEKVKGLAYYPTLQFCLNKFNEEFGTMMVSEIRPVDMEDYQAKRKKEGRADNTIDQQIGCAKTMIVKAFDNGLIGGETLRVFKKIKKMLKRNANARDRILSPEEYHRLFEESPAHLKPIIAMGYYTGMREGEILRLTWGKLFLKERLIRLEAKDTKDREPRLIPICDELFSVLNRIPEPLHEKLGKPVFLYEGGPIKNIRKALRHACKEAGISYGRFNKDGFVFHDLRHTFNTYMRKAGVAESVIMGITGHSTREMFDRYNRVDVEDKKEAIGKFEAYLVSVSKPLAENGLSR